MSSTFAVSRNHLIFGVCLPLGVLLGYLLADIADPISKFVVVAAICVLSFPLFIRWYHPLLLFFWNIGMTLTFLPGRPTAWSLLAFVGLFFALLNRSVNSEHKFMYIPYLTWPIVTFVAVVLSTAAMTGGISIHMFGGSSGGGRNYFFMMAAILGLFAMSSQQISPKHAQSFIALYFLPGAIAMIAKLMMMNGIATGALLRVFPQGESDSAFYSTQSEAFGETRHGEMMLASFAIFCWMLARYGVKGTMDISRPWRPIVFVMAIVAGFFGGFRSHLILIVLTFGLMFMIQGLWRTKAVWILLVGTLLTGGIIIKFADKMPQTIQRCLSFLPVEIDPMIKAQAESSSQWRLAIWKIVVQEVPTYFFKGKGYNISATDIYMANMNIAKFGMTSSHEIAVQTGNYHNGPLSVIIPFGIWGLLAFMWIIAAGIVFLYRTHRDSSTELKNINALLLSVFLARAIFFFAIFGAIELELYFFTGILGLSIALNVARKPAPAPAPEGNLAYQV
jgi:hypothetical protein